MAAIAQVGDRLILRRVETRFPQPDGEVTVVRVGRKWGYAKQDNFRDEVKFDLETGYEDGRGFSPTHRVLTATMDEDEKRRTAALAAMKERDLAFTYGAARHVSTEALEAIVTILAAGVTR